MRKKSRAGEIGKRIATSRFQQGFSQSLVARRAGLDPSYLSRIENGRVHPTVGTAMRIAEALRISLADLLGPSPSGQRERPCPVSPSGRCFLDLVDREAGSRRGLETFSSRQIRLLGRFARLVERGDPALLRALEVLAGEILEGAGTRRR
jgi:transcriptional regulator with XRE-family HTH domain